MMRCAVTVYVIARSIFLKGTVNAHLYFHVSKEQFLMFTYCIGVSFKEFKLTEWGSTVYIKFNAECS